MEEVGAWGTGNTGGVCAGSFLDVAVYDLCVVHRRALPLREFHSCSLFRFPRIPTSLIESCKCCTSVKDIVTVGAQARFQKLATSLQLNRRNKTFLSKEPTGSEAVHRCDVSTYPGISSRLRGRLLRNGDICWMARSTLWKSKAGGRRRGGVKGRSVPDYQAGVCIDVDTQSGCFRGDEAFCSSVRSMMCGSTSPWSV